MNYRLPNGNTVCLPYLAALIRLADEIDASSSRNPLILFDLDLLTDATQIQINKILMAVKYVKMTAAAFILYTETEDEELYSRIEKTVVKMQETLDLCRAVVNGRTAFRITQ